MIHVVIMDIRGKIIAILNVMSVAQNISCTMEILLKSFLLFKSFLLLT